MADAARRIDRIDTAPRLPSLPVPDRITPIARSPRSSASERKKMSIGVGGLRSLVCWLSCSTPSRIRRSWRGGIR